jgi:hypothetical protein
MQAGNPNIHPVLFDDYRKRLRKGVAGVLPVENADDKYFELNQKLKLNVSRFAAAKAYQATQLIRKAAGTAEYEKQAKLILNTFNRYGEAEYNAAVARTRTGKQWIDFNDDPGKNELYPNLKWLPSRSASPREEHIPFYNRVFAKNDPFWATNQPGSVWGCKCDWEETDEPASGITAGDVLPSKGLKGNPGQTGEIFSPDASYFTENAKKGIADTTYPDAVSNMKINVNADKNEIADNVRTGRVLMKNFPEMNLEIRRHIRDQTNGPVKNPEYAINGRLADAKRLESWNVASGFNRAIKQEDKVVILDFFKMQKHRLPTSELAKNIVRRYKDFMTGKIEQCYVVWNDKSVLIDKSLFGKFKWEKRELYYKTVIGKLNKMKQGTKSPE